MFLVVLLLKVVPGYLFVVELVVVGLPILLLYYRTVYLHMILVDAVVGGEGLILEGGHQGGMDLD
jgi:hypothetical protein